MYLKKLKRLIFKKKVKTTNNLGLREHKLRMLFLTSKLVNAHSNLSSNTTFGTPPRRKSTYFLFKPFVWTHAPVIGVDRSKKKEKTDLIEAWGRDKGVRCFRITLADKDMLIRYVWNTIMARQNPIVFCSLHQRLPLFQLHITEEIGEKMRWHKANQIIL